MGQEIKKYEYLMRGKFLFCECSTPEDMVKALETAITHIREMTKAGAKLTGGLEDDYATFELETTAASVAHDLGMTEVEEEDCEEDLT